jgi:hypothetical protein
MNDKYIIELREKILKGIEMAFDKLVLMKKKNDGKLVLSKDDKIIIINACDYTK